MKSYFKTLFKYAWTELIRYKSMTIFLILNFVLGLLGFFILQIFQTSLMNRSLDQARSALTADISISARRAFTEDEKKTWEKLIPFERKSHEYSMFSMLRVGEDSKLVDVLVIDDRYPLYGSLTIKGLDLNSIHAPKETYIWIDPDIAENLSIKNNQLIQLGDIKFKVAGSISDDSTRLLRIGSLASRVIIYEKDLKQAGLLQSGSTFTESWNYKLPVGIDPVAIKKSIEKEVKDLDVRIEAVGEGGEGSTQVLKYFTDYLGLVALVALGLCLLCGSYLLQWIFESRKRNIAIYQILGFQNNQILVIYLFQTLILAVLCCLISYIGMLLFLPLLQNLVNEKFQLNIALSIQPRMLLVTSICGVLAPVFLSLPQFIRISEMSPNELIVNESKKTKTSKLYLVCLS